MITGSLVALITPMHPNGDLDWDALARLVEWHVECGTDALVPVGTTGESPTVDRRRAQEDHGVRRRADAREAPCRVIGVFTGANATSEAIELTQAAKDVGCDACLLVTPYYNKPTQEGLYLHHKAVAEAVSVPQLLYNVPGRTACDMLPETVERLAKVVPRIAGIKEATGSVERAKDILARVSKDFAVYSGDDETALGLMFAGGHGVISVTANLAPAAVHRMAKAALAGDTAKAHAESERLAELDKCLFVETNPIPVKWALHEMGRIGPGIRLPMTPLSEARRAPLRAALVRAGLVTG